MEAQAWVAKCSNVKWQSAFLVPAHLGGNIKPCRELKQVHVEAVAVNLVENAAVNEGVELRDIASVAARRNMKLVRLLLVARGFSHHVL